MIPRLLISLAFTLAFPLAFTTTLAAQPAQFDVRISAGPYDPQQRADVTVELETRVPLVDAEELVLDIDVLGSVAIEFWSTAEGITCVEKGEHWLQCNPSPSAAKTSVSLRVKTQFESRTGFISTGLTWRERGFQRERSAWRKDLYRFAREFVVTNPGDAGPGSLRQAILDANAGCNHFEGPCLIRFDLGPAAIIYPVVPLPAVAGPYVTIDGESRVTLDGTLQNAPENGLLLAGPVFGDVVVRNLTIQAFPENGIEIRVQARVESCVIRDNRSRGIVVIGGGHANIADNVITGNRRSGIFADRATPIVRRNRIEGNGASGIFVGSRSAAVIVHNDIIGNGHFGVATVRENRDVDVGRNRIAGNRAGQIDIDLDGPSFFQPADRNEYRPPNGPMLLSATYDAASNKTTVTGRLEGVEFFYFLTYDLQFFATTSANEADQYLGTIHVQQPDFTATFPGDLRGRFITANTIRWVHDEVINRGTSELASPIEVR